MSRRILIAGNWKMNLNTSQASILVHRLQERIKIHRDVEVVLCPSMMVLQPLSMQIDRRKFRLGAQNAYSEDDGAYTGEVAISMLRDLVHYVIVGHSERRHVFNESDDTIAKKVTACLRNELSPILCVGETKSERLAKETKQVLHDQLTVGLRGVVANELSDLVIAYEPVWAIGTGVNAKPDQVVEALEVIRKNLIRLFGERAAKKVRVLYGGSVTPDTARAYLDIEGIDGLLVGGASLNYQQFASIVEAAFKLKQGEDNG